MVEIIKVKTIYYNKPFSQVHHVYRYHSRSWVVYDIVFGHISHHKTIIYGIDNQLQIYIYIYI